MACEQDYDIISINVNEFVDFILFIFKHGGVNFD